MNLYQLTLIRANKAVSYDILGARIRSVAHERIERECEKQKQEMWNQLEQDQRIENETD